MKDSTQYLSSFHDLPELPDTPQEEPEEIVPGSLEDIRRFAQATKRRTIRVKRRLGPDYIKKL